jgi:sec-independent protein translocase protein TatB
VTASHGKVSLHLMGTPPIQIASLGMWDSLILMVMALVVFGPRRLPEIGRQIGKLMYEFRKASNDFKFQMEEELRNAEDADRRKKEEERLRALAAAPQQPALAAEVSPVSESRPGAPSDSQAITDGSSPVSDSAPEFPDPLSLPENSDGRGREPIMLESVPEEVGPRIMPPSTGEQVLAARPNSRTAPVQPANGAEGVVADEPQPAAGHGPAVQTELFAEDSKAEQTTPDAEQAAHHG